MNCTECKELLVAYVEGLLDESQKQVVAEHLKDCASCRSQARELTDLHDRLVRNGEALAQDLTAEADSGGHHAHDHLLVGQQFSSYPSDDV